MRAVLDACVLYPSVMRDLLLGAAARGLYEPRWSDRILEEWARATVKLGPAAEAVARADIAQMRLHFPSAFALPATGVEARLILPDPDDVHVLATAITTHADAIVTTNAKDFPRHLLAEEGISRRDPDGFLWELWSHHPDQMGAVVAKVHATAERMAGGPLSLTALLKRARLNRLAKAVTA
ncbi:RSP_2648 family PIN domain-containing protein [Paragemmobacter straminiformis]|uniref:PIN domain-containing protein n=1 Tax=Paragemmobacter straminiformis TaxID=2045119 RepID=A0A842I6W9_9RHOB|nr:PIN domain-containing protein [Gemmobacter straminiformis]MBC2835341.1 PIN domain-containing protein [Gemmobacter straminiformis]